MSDEVFIDRDEVAKQSAVIRHAGGNMRLRKKPDLGIATFGLIGQVFTFNLRVNTGELERMVNSCGAAMEAVAEHADITLAMLRDIDREAAQKLEEAGK